MCSSTFQRKVSVPATKAPYFRNRICARIPVWLGLQRKHCCSALVSGFRSSLRPSPLTKAIVAVVSARWRTDSANESDRTGVVSSGDLS